MTLNGTAHPAVLTPASWPAATLALSDAARHRLQADLDEHAGLTQEHAQRMRAYIELLQPGARLTCTQAQGGAFDICELERKLHVLEEQRVGSDPTMSEIVAQADTFSPRSSIQVERNSRGFNWTAKLYAEKGETDDELLARVRMITVQLQ